jgi:hypothetical protein
MRFRSSASLAIAIGLFFGVSGSAKVSPELLKACKSATAYLEAPDGSGSATAFCIHRSGYFVTNQHVVDREAEGARVRLVIYSASGTQRIVEATVVRKDETSDLALLRAEGGTDMPPLRFGVDTNILETAEVTAFGYPFGKGLASEGEYPSITVTTGSITALRHKKGILERIQFDADVNPGNSGGPLVDAEGRVIGVVVAGITGTGLKFAVPISHLVRFLQKPALTFVPPELDTRSARQPIVFRLQAAQLADFKSPLTIELVLTTGRLGKRHYLMKEVKPDVFEARVPYALPLAAAKTLTIEAVYPDGIVKCSVPDTPLRVGDKAISLSDTVSITLGESPAVTKKDGTSIAGPISGISAVRGTLSSTSMTLDLSKATGVKIEDPEDVGSVEYAFRVMSADEVLVDEVEGSVPIQGGTHVKRGIPDGFRRGLVLYYPLDARPAADRVEDQSGKGHTGVARNVAWREDGKVGGAGVFHSAVINVGAMNDFPLAQVSMACWARADRIQGSPTLCGKAGAYTLQVVNGRLRWCISTAENQWGGAELYAASAFATRKWVHLVGTYDGATMHLYVDGSRVNATAPARGPIDYSYGGGRLFFIGMEASTGNVPANEYDGDLDEVLVWDRALTDQEVSALYRAQR